MALEKKGACSQYAAELYGKLDEIIAEYKGRPGALIPVLHKAQTLFGYLPEDVQIKVAEGLDVPAVEVNGVATFYSLFSTEPRGKHIVGLCLGTACYVRGAGEIGRKLEELLGCKMNSTTEDMMFSLDATRCIGACGLAPVMTVGEDVYGRLTLDKIPEIIEKYKTAAN